MKKSIKTLTKNEIGNVSGMGLGHEIFNSVLGFVGPVAGFIVGLSIYITITKPGPNRIRV